MKHINRKTWIGIGYVIGLWVPLNLIAGESPQVLLYDLKSGFLYHMGYLSAVVVVLVLFVLKERSRVRLKWRIRFGASRFLQLPPAPDSRYYKLFYGLCIVIGVTLMAVWGISDHDTRNTRWNGTWQGDLLIGHSFSGVDESTYTGSREAFFEGYENGYRTFEVDIMFTSDDELVLVHEWPQAAEAAGHEEWKEKAPTMCEFLEAPIWGEYTPLALSDLFGLMQEYPDIWIVTDTKYTDSEQVSRQFNKLVETARVNNCAEVLERVVVQIYNERMLETVQSIYPFSSYIFTMYQRWWGGDMREFGEICRWCVSHGGDAITMPGTFSYEKAWRIASTYGIDVYVHTINDVSEAERYLDGGIRGVYTDFIRRDELGGRID